MKVKYFQLLFLILLASCNSDPCENVVCDNGNCIDGDCICDSGFEGADCSIYSTPNTIELDKIRVTQYPYINSQLDEPWDIDPAPDNLFADLIVSIYDFTAQTGLVLKFEPNEAQKLDTDPSLIHEFYTDQTYYIENLDGLHYINLTDNDALSPDEEIKNIPFKPDTVFMNNPNTVSMILDSVKIEVDVLYSF